ncbi:MAG TPA: SDR family NAD(P)-dependent oxidoreductase [Bryobacteraceae bacterium]|jgi:3-oxoacyl-[acyl-carrier protein] reductase|nr:SDR family NAD(P)-dependent oxidoreductase [Bryobacteraceae bacterium]
MERLALVTGASRGLGRAIAIALANAGFDVAVHYHRKEADARTVAAKIGALGRRVEIFQADVSREADVARLAGEVPRSFSQPVSVVVNNAGIALRHDPFAITPAQWDEVIDTNLKSAYLVTQAFLPPMRQQHWGRIVFLSSVAASIGGVVGPHYAASKSGMLGLMRYYARYLAAEGITSNAIAPALIETDMTAHAPDKLASMIPVGRLGTPDEVSDIAVLLATNGYVTGQTIHPNGGLYPT